MFTQGFTVVGASLTMLKPGEHGIITRLRGFNATVQEELSALGLTLGLYIRLEQRFPALVACFGEQCLQLSPELAQNIYVRLL